MLSPPTVVLDTDSARSFKCELMSQTCNVMENKFGDEVTRKLASRQIFIQSLPSDLSKLLSSTPIFNNLNYMVLQEVCKLCDNKIQVAFKTEAESFINFWICGLIMANIMQVFNQESE